MPASIRSARPLSALVIAAAVLAAPLAQASDPAPIKVAFIDQLSGPLSNVGEQFLANLKLAVEDANAQPQGVLNGARYELSTYDNKLSAQDSLSALQSAIDAGAKVVFTGGSGSSVVAAMVDAATKHNERNPEQRVLIINYASIDPDLTGAHCSFWHFATEANTAMKMRALANFVKTQSDIHQVYSLNQDYAHGRLWASLGKQMISAARPDVRFTGETLHPIGKVKDFAPYVSKAKATGADTILTGNWGQDLNLLIKAAGDMGYDVRYLNHSGAGAPGTVLAVSQAKLGKVTWVSEWTPGNGNAQLMQMDARVRQTPAGEHFAPRTILSVELLTDAIRKANSTDPLKIALALEGMQKQSFLGEVTMRKTDHQLLLPQVVSTIAPVDGKAVKVGYDGTQWGHKTESTTSAKDLDLPTLCRMKRPAGA
ncbi:Leucine-, isoleucine-, valine-, threonine-, and alanine-binding protein [Ralstonia condita]|jgi:ABC-type branched-subunit amino acid transport system substrate-binding protein|uniref:Leucine-, isoleucine-, valine-, threonine-, and alanine-binding protein n=1 Tax=Ralstonia condita TaxID=3058600 RepID=A0ABN9IBX5_9RALS|nr:branched-chain amino acid ABC transporter substrate-binding protein [Ralstonia sp. LMG 7141]MDE2204153.1 branched-chain amino acid ABC transporter substrate-binding protein [Burkholderiaceae bacterium]CAJ0776675.1 Leucine-, isoleucine-, valine-, threonine-, and alanine-binding protein [Ralstonia sp. LMG 7141]